MLVLRAGLVFGIFETQKCKTLWGTYLLQVEVTTNYINQASKNNNQVIFGIPKHGSLPVIPVLVGEAVE